MGEPRSFRDCRVETKSQQDFLFHRACQGNYHILSCCNSKACLEIGDFNGAKCILTGIQHSPVHRLEKTWSLISKQRMQIFDKIASIMSPEDNAIVYRKRLQRTPSPCVPFLGYHLGDLVYLNELKRSKKGADSESAHKEDAVSSLRQ